MHDVIYVNGTVVEAAKARLAPLSWATFYSRGVFTDVSIRHGRPFLWAEHWRRLIDDARRLNLEVSDFGEAKLLESIKKLISVNKVPEGCAQVILLARSESDVSKGKGTATRKTDLLITTRDRRKGAQGGLTLAVSPYRCNTLSPLVGIKSLNYLEQVLSLEEARSREFDEAVVLNERGEIAGATMSNIFWVKDGTVHTPALSTGAFPGVTRVATIKTAAKCSTPLIEGIYELSDLTDADEIFLTSASLGVGIVTTFDFRQYSVLTGSIAAQLRNSLEALSAKEAPSEV